MDSKNNFSIKFILILVLLVFFYMHSNAQKNSWWDIYLQDTMHLNILKTDNENLRNILNQTFTEINKCKFASLKKNDFALNLLIIKDSNDILFKISTIQNKSEIFYETYIRKFKPYGVLVYLDYPIVVWFRLEDEDIANVVKTKFLQFAQNEYVLHKETNYTSILNRKKAIETFYASYKYSDGLLKQEECVPCRPIKKKLRK